MGLDLVPRWTVARASRAQPASSRATPTTRRCAGLDWRARSGRTLSSRTSSRRRRPISSAGSTATSGSPTEGTSPSRSTPTARRSTPSPRTTGICSGAASWTSPRPKSVVKHLMGERLFSGWGVRTMAIGRDALQPHRLPHRDDLAVRQLVHRVGPPPLRVQRRGGADRGRHPRRGRVLRRPAARGIRRLSALGDEVPGAVPHRMQPAGVVDRERRSCSCGRCSDLEPLGDHLVVDPALPAGIGLLELLDIPGRWGRMDAFGRGRVAMPDEQGLRPQLG